jgi:hypothetical protein
MAHASRATKATQWIAPFSISTLGIVYDVAQKIYNAVKQIYQAIRTKTNN